MSSFGKVYVFEKIYLRLILMLLRSQICTLLQFSFWNILFFVNIFNMNTHKNLQIFNLRLHSIIIYFYSCADTLHCFTQKLHRVYIIAKLLCATCIHVPYLQIYSKEIHIYRYTDICNYNTIYHHNNK